MTSNINQVRCALTLQYIPISNAIMCRVGRYKNAYIQLDYVTYKEVDGEIGICTIFDNYKKK